MTKNLIKHDLKWVDALRILACILVVLAHTCDPIVSGTDPNAFTAGAIIGTLCRVSVPLFMMISGVLLLPTSMRLGAFYSKRLKRILVPFIFWSLTAPFLFYFLVNTINTVSPTIIPEAHSLKATLKYTYLWLFNFNFATIPYWYIYMLLGVYLIIPLISDWVRSATRKELHIILGIWLFTTIIPYLELSAPFFGYKGNYGSMGIFGVCSWNTFGTFHYLSGFLGYLLLGHYLVKFPVKWSFNKTLIISILLFAVGYAITLKGFMFTRVTFPENFNALEIIWSFTSLNVLMMTLACFFVFQKLRIKGEGKFLAKVSEATYGVFLAHFIIVYILFELIFPNILMPAILLIPTVGLSAFVVTTALVMLLRRSKIGRRIS